MVPAATNSEGLRIGELARRTATSARSLRYYEQQGLIAAERDPNGYRRYDEDVVNVVNNLRRLLDAGLSIDDINQFGYCIRTPDLDAVPCSTALEVHERRLETLDTRIATLNHLRANLVEQTERLRSELRARSGL